MKRNQLQSLDRPRFATFKEIDDYYEGIIVAEPEWVDDPVNSGQQMLKIVIQDDRGIYWQLNARTQMPEAIDNALADADVDEMIVGGRLMVKWVESRGNTKVYKATYKPPANDGAPF